MASSIRQVSVWLDESAPQRGAFPHALEWASRLDLPLRAIVASEEKMRKLSADGRASQDVGRRQSPPARTVLADILAACASASALAGIPWEYKLWQGPVSAGVEQFLQPATVSVFGSALAAAVKGELLRQSLHGPAHPVVVCPQTWQPFSRVLVVHQAGDAADSFLAGVARLCGDLRVAPVVLTVARHDAEALVRQRAAQETWAALGLAADFDIMIGCDVRTAVASVSRWRRCTHVFVERPRAASWWRWLRGETLVRLLGLTDSFSLLALPADTRAAREREAAPPVRQTVGGRPFR